MSEFNRESVYSAGTTLQQYITKVFTIMGIGVGITGLVAWFGYMNLINGGWLYDILVSSYTFFMLIVCAAQIGIAVAMGRGLTTMKTSTAKTLFFVYSALTGLTCSVLPLAFGISTVFTAFAFAAVMFGSCAVIGHFTNVDLSKFSGLMIGGLFAMVIASVLSMFIPALQGTLVISYIGIILFMALTAWDMQKIKNYYYSTMHDGTLSGNLAIYSAFQLYLDFINLFLYILRILGNRSRD